MSGKILAAILITQMLSNGIWLITMVDKDYASMVVLGGLLCAIGLIVSLIANWDN